MVFKKMDNNFGFAPVRSSGPTGQADLALASSLKHNRSLKLMKNLNASIHWSSIEAMRLLQNGYETKINLQTTSGKS